ncbi:TonB-dependent receptor [Rhizorhabdus wittichii]|uniref:TonB-dependent receptor n=1 Tax=Rhizorhabdus wittichii TaxID=160791 RepID=A0A975D0R5_9SPHN|nr:TonB-dependent receptor [Rhizorhabdus wittichii]QTH20126.1 TonB-dependent receptor [Rhizorhabdus wittichii]
MISSSRRKALECLLGLSLSHLVAAAAPALAQATPAGAANPELDASQIGDIVVTAERRSAKLQDVPLAVTAFDSAALEKRGIVRMGDVGALAPSLEIHSTSRPGGGGSSIAAYIRGVGTGDYNIPTDPAIGIYVDGVYMARSVGGLLSLTDVEQIQVLNGPQGTLYGRNTLGGAILVTTRKPSLSGDMEGQVGARLGNYRRRDAWASVNGPLVEDKVGFKLSVSSLNSDGWARQALTGRHLSDEHRLIIQGGLQFGLTEDLSLILSGDYTRQRQNPPIVPSVALTNPSARLAQFNTLVAPALNAGLGLPAGSIADSRWLSPDYKTGYSTLPVRDDSDIGGGSLRLAYTPSDSFNVNATLAYRRLTADILVSSDGTPYNLFVGGSDFHDRQFSAELTVGGKVADDRLTYLVGGYYFREKARTVDTSQTFHGLYEATNIAANALDTLTRQRMTAESYAFFTQETFALLPNLNITGGARINHDSKYYAASVFRPQLNAIGVPEQASKPGWTSFTPKLGIDWKPVRDILLYASYAKGFKSGGVAMPLLGVPPTSYDPEKLTTYEAGWKSTLFDRHVTFNASGYISRYRDVQLTSIVALPGGGSGRPTQNAGDAHISGVEGQVTVRPVRRLSFNLGGGYVHARFSRLTPGAISALGAKVGDRLPQIPDYNIFAGAEYGFDAMSGVFTLRGDVKRTGKTQLTPGDLVSMRPAYTLVNASISYAPDWAAGLELAVRGTNITNRKYIVFSSSSPSTGYRGVIPGNPAEWYASAVFRF